MTAYTEKQYVEEMIATRRKIHQTPEEGWTEFQTTWLVAERLRALGAARHTSHQSQSGDGP